MTIKEYQDFCKEGLRKEFEGEKNVWHYAIGLGGEVGEVLNCIKKRDFHGRVDEVTVEDIVDEVGDVLWYVMNLTSALGYSIDDVIDKNVKKLENRYKNLYNK